MSDEELCGWSEYIWEYLLDGRTTCEAGALFNVSTGAYEGIAGYAEGDEAEKMMALVQAGKHLLWKDEEYDTEVMKEDGVSKETVKINETETLVELLNGMRPANGVWFGGKKYTIIHEGEETTQGDTTYTSYFLACEKKGINILKWGTSYAVLSLHDEDLKQVRSGSNGALLVFADYVISSGY